MEKIIEIKGYFSVEELSSIFDVTEETVRRWIRSGKLKSFMSSKREGNIVCSDDVSAFCASFKPQYKAKWIAYCKYCKKYEDSLQAVHWKTEHGWRWQSLSPGYSTAAIKCKDCKWWVGHESDTYGQCTLMGIYPTGDWFCANAQSDYGRKEE